MNMFADERLDLDAMLWLIPDALKPHSTSEQIGTFLRDALALGPLDREQVLAEIAKATGKPIGLLRKELRELEKAAAAQAKLDQVAASGGGRDVELAEDEIATAVWRDRFNGGDRKAEKADEKADPHLVYTAASFYAYAKTHWRLLDDAVLARALIERSDKLFPDLPNRSRVVAGAQAQLRARAAKGDFFDLRGEARPLINVRNGVLVVKPDGTVALRPHRTADAMLFCLPVNYNPAAECPQFDRMLTDITAPVDAQGKLIEQPDDEELAEAAELRRHIEELIGYTLYSRRFVKAFTIWYGEGDNGKTTLLTILSALVGQSAVANMRLHTLEQNRFALGHLPGKLLLVDDDVKKGAKLPDGLIKQISERKLITAETKGKDPFEFIIRAFVMLLCNSLPELDDGGRAIASRAHLVPFRRSFAPEEQDRHLAARIIADELAGVLDVALAGLRRVLERQGFNEPAACRELKAEWLGSTHTVLDWVEDRCELVEDGLTAVAVLKADYDAWCIKNTKQRVAPSPQWLSKKIIEQTRSGNQLKVDHHKGTGGTRMLAGIKLLPVPAKPENE